jgi:hypothetical protein
MTPDPRDALLEPRQYIDDDGFTSRVMGALPPRKAHGRARAWILSSAVAAAAVAFIAGPARVVLSVGFSTPVPWAGALCIAVLAGTAASIALREAERVG